MPVFQFDSTQLWVYEYHFFTDKLQKKLRSEGGIKALLGMVRCGHPDVLSQVARGIANFAKCESRAATQGKSSITPVGYPCWSVDFFLCYDLGGLDLLMSSICGLSGNVISIKLLGSVKIRLCEKLGDLNFMLVNWKHLKSYILVLLVWHAIEYHWLYGEGGVTRDKREREEVFFVSCLFYLLVWVWGRGS